MRAMKIELDERSASDVAELVVSKVSEKLWEKVALRSPGDDQLGGFKTTYLRTLLRCHILWGKKR